MTFERQYIQIIDNPAVTLNVDTITNEVRQDVFVSYSHQDKQWLAEVQRHFRLLERYIHFWDDSRIVAGSQWRNEIDKALSRCKIAILMVSADFLASSFIMNVELPYLVKQSNEGNLVLLTVVLKPCLFDEVDDLARIQAVNSPSSPVVGMTEIEREMFWVKLSKEIKRLAV